MSDIQKRVADILRGQGVGDECLVDETRPGRLAEVLVAKLGLTKMHETGDTSGSFQYVTPWQKPDE